MPTGVGQVLPPRSVLVSVSPELSQPLCASGGHATGSGRELLQEGVCVRGEGKREREEGEGR